MIILLIIITAMYIACIFETVKRYEPMLDIEEESSPAQCANRREYRDKDY